MINVYLDSVAINLAAMLVIICYVNQHACSYTSTTCKIARRGEQARVGDEQASERASVGGRVDRWTSGGGRTRRQRAGSGGRWWTWHGGTVRPGRAANR